MAYRLEADESVEDGIKRVCTDQVERALSELDAPDLDPHVLVHSLRKRCKKIRGALRVVRSCLAGRDTYKRENRWFRDAARQLSDARDAAVLVETLDALIEPSANRLGTKTLARVRSHFAWRRRRIGESDELRDELRRFRAGMVDSTERISELSLTAEGFEAVRAGLERTYRRARNRYPEAYEKGTAAAFHLWRKRVKYHWYHCRLLQDVQPEVIGARCDEAHRLAGILGEKHDLAVLEESLERTASSLDDGQAVERLTTLASQRREELRRQARALAEGLLAERPSALSRRLEPYWAGWH